MKRRFSLKGIRAVVLRLKNELLGCVRGKGLFWAIELVKDWFTKEKATETTERIMYQCLMEGLCFKVSHGNIIL